jgi:hypothetical protein
MIVTEELKINDSFFLKTYSSEGFFIERDGVKYIDAVDPQFLGREYIETNEKIPAEESEELDFSEEV